MAEHAHEGIVAAAGAEDHRGEEEAGAYRAEGDDDGKRVSPAATESRLAVACEEGRRHADERKDVDGARERVPEGRVDPAADDEHVRHHEAADAERVEEAPRADGRRERHGGDGGVGRSGE